MKKYFIIIITILILITINNRYNLYTYNTSTYIPKDIDISDVINTTTDNSENFIHTSDNFHPQKQSYHYSEIENNNLRYIHHNTKKHSYHCDGRIYCGQMKSCLEAKYFLNNCPNQKTDGDHDGIPCERQWCR
jgi:hypothetical protein